MSTESALSRRKFLQATTAGAALVGAAGAVTSCTQAAQSPYALPSKWDKETDIVIAGSGAGLLAAVEAADAGSKVILVEKAKELGGETAVCMSWISAAGTKLQKANGVTDTAEAHWKKWQEVNAANVPIAKLDLCKLYVDQAGPAVDRLADLGMPFKLNSDFVHEVPRAHLMQPNAGAWVTVLQPLAVKKGVEILTETAATELILAPDKSVVGLKVTQGGKTLNIKANKAVILATGDCASATAIKKVFVDAKIAAARGYITTNTGDGLLIAMAVGAGVNFLGTVSSPSIFPGRWTTAPSADMTNGGSIWVNKNGKRFANEIGSDAAFALDKQPDGVAWLILDQQIAALVSKGKKAYLAMISGIGNAFLEDWLAFDNRVMKAETLAALAQAAGIDAANLAATVTTYNAAVDAKKDAEFNRTVFGNKLAQAPFYAIKGTMAAVTTGNGPSVNVNASMQALDVWGKVIPRLYISGPGLMGGTGVVCGGSGHHMACVVSTGRIAGIQSAKEKAWA